MKKHIISIAIIAILCSGYATNANSSELSSVYTSSVSSSNKWDKILDEYEKYINQYVKAYKKAMEGDEDAIEEYTKLMAKAQKLAKQLEGAQGEMTPAQIKRFGQISQKMLNIF